MEKKCVLCEKVKGVIVNVEKFGYVHISCVNWDTDIYFEEISTIIDGELTKARKNLICMYCKVKGGYCIQCEYKSCAKSFHVKCAVSKGCITNWEEMK